ncbi:unnamed protein product, partial [Rotaria magnacalcarata]
IKMQNLSLYNTRAIGLHDLTGANVARRFAIDTDKQIIYLLNSHSIYSLTLEDEKLKSIYTTTDKTITLEDLSYISELNHLCFGLSNGDLVSIQFDNDFDENVNVIGTLEECIHELKSSPDLQILVAVTNSKVLLLSTNNDYEPIAEAILDTSEFGEQQLVNVGWGSKTTQFHGSVGKKAALETAQTTPTTLRANDDDNRSRIVWRDDGDLFAISFISLTNQWRTIKIFNKQGQLQATNESPLNGFIESAIAWKISGEFIGAAMRFNNGQKLTISFLEKNGLKHGELVLETAVLNGRFVGLTENYRLYLNTAELAHNCNSYFIHDKTILVYSTLQHQLAFRSLVNDEIVAGISQRRTERGTRIVCTAFTDLKLVLQMPRGNLETIYPRPLLLTYISADLIDSETTNYKRAFELMRKNRLNLNFLYDYNPKQFFDNIPSFISKTRSDDDICLFISEIDNEKNTREEYMKYILKQEKHPPIDAKIWHPKANLLCEKFRSCLLSTENCTEHMNSILTTFVKQSPPNMEGALVFLSQHPKYFDNAIRYLTYFIDIDRLYDTALGTYNFDLVLMISEKTQKDPKEYLPELNQLRLINNYHWQKFKIDCRLKRFKKAIENACDYFVEQLLNRPDEHENERFQEFINILENNHPQFADDRRTLVTRSNRNADDSGSIKTRLTKKSGSVSSSKKSQRRAAQQLEKLIQLKEGSKHEDLAIVRELWLLVTKIDKQNYDVRHVNKICYQISTHQNSLEYEQKGELLQNKYNEYLNAIEKQLTTIWLTNPEQQQQENVQVMVINKKIREKFKKELDLVSNQYRVSPVLVSKTSQWKLVLFDSDISV